MINELLNQSEAVRLKAVSSLSLDDSASAFKHWFADRSKHQLSATDIQCDTLEALLTEKGVNAQDLYDLTQTNILFEYEDKMVIVKYTVDGDPLSGNANHLSLAFAASGETWPLIVTWRDDTYWYRIDGVTESVRELIDTVTDTVDVVTTESEMLIDFNQNLLTAVQDRNSNFDSIIAAGLNSSSQAVRLEATALAKIPAESKAYAVIAYVQDWFGKSYAAAEQAYDEDPDSDSFSLGDYAASNVSSMMAGAWEALSSTVSAIGTLLAVVGSAFAKVAGVVLMAGATAVNYFVNMANQNEHMTIGSGKNFLYANGQPVVFNAHNQTQSDLWSKNEKFVGNIGTLLKTSNKDYNPMDYEYPCSSIWYPSALRRYVKSDAYFNGLRAAFSKALQDQPVYIRTRRYVRLTNPNDASLLATTAAECSSDQETVLNRATLRIRTEFSEEDAAASDLGQAIFNNSYALNLTEDLTNHLTDDDSMALAESMAKHGVVLNIIDRAWEIAIETIIRATARIYNGSLVKFNSVLGFNAKTFWDKLYNRFNGWGFGTLGFPDATKGTYVLKNFVISLITGGPAGIPSSVGYSQIEWSWDEVNQLISQEIDLNVKTSGSETFLSLWSSRASYGKFLNMILGFIYFYVTDIVTDTDYYSDLLDHMTVDDIANSWIRAQDLVSVGQVGVEAFHAIPNPWVVITDDPALVTDPLVTPPKWASGSTALTVLGVAVVAAAAITTAVVVSRAWRKHSVDRVVQKEKKAKDTLAQLEAIDPKSDPTAYKQAFKAYYKAQRKFQRYATRVGYASNNVGSFDNIFTPSSSDLLSKLPDCINSANAVAADQCFVNGVDGIEETQDLSTDLILSTEQLTKLIKG